ncbi:hypothetical protein D9M71_826180 [compost metagenome]
MRVVFPGKTDATVQLNRLGGTVEKRLAGMNLGGGSCCQQLSGNGHIARWIKTFLGYTGGVPGR